MLSRQFLVETVALFVLGAALLATAKHATSSRLPSINAGQAGKLWAKALRNRDEGNPGQALSLTQKLLRSFPNNPMYLSFQAEMFREMKRYRDEAASWELYMKTAPFPTEACPHIAKAYDNMEKPGLALAAHRRCLALDPGKSDLQLYLALALEREGQDDEALQLYQSILEKSPGYSDAKLGLARILTGRNFLSQAQSLVESVLQNSPKNTDALLAAGKIADKQGRREEAKDYLRQAIAQSPTYKDLYRILGRWLEQDAQPQEAIKIWESLLKLDPDDAALRTKLHKLKS